MMKFNSFDFVTAKEEAKMLFEEARMPIEKLLAKYQAQKEASLVANEVAADSGEAATSANADSKCEEKLLCNGDNGDSFINGPSHACSSSVEALQRCDTSCSGTSNRDTTSSSGDGAHSSLNVRTHICIMCHKLRLTIFYYYGYMCKQQ
jgi:hypothetical protein